MFQCSSCGAAQPKWSGKCSTCGEWNTLTESTKPEKRTGKLKESGNIKETLRISTEAQADTARITLQSKELSNAIGGGIVPGSLLLLS